MELAPWRVTLPVEPISLPMKQYLLETFPPLVMARVPLPPLPTSKKEELVQVELAPSTVTLPVEPPRYPMEPSVLETFPPLVMATVPLPQWPT